MTDFVNDPRPMFVRALDQIQQLIDAVEPDDLDLPTPCQEYDVRTLQGHLLSVVGRINLALTGGNALDIPSITTTTTTDVMGTWKERRARLDLTLADDAVLHQTCKLPWGTLPGAAAIAAYTGELTTHAWDLAKATGRLDRLDDDLATYLLPLVQQFIPADPRGGHVPFGPVVPVADDASPYDRLAAWQGRQP